MNSNQFRLRVLSILEQVIENPSTKINQMMVNSARDHQNKQ